MKGEHANESGCSTVASVREKPVRASRQTLEEARASHREQGFARYGGPKLAGERTVLEHGEEGYPDALMSVKNPPKRLFVVGDPGALQDGLAVVGARKATPYGLSCARRFARMAAEAGVCVISGGARGCDAQAHQGALEGGGRTVVVLGSGCDELYPAEHYALFQKVIDQGGAVVSEQEWGFPPLPYAFRARNRIIAGLSRGTLVVEAGLPSGTFSTADAALAAGRDVLAVPGAITAKTSRGCNRLIAQGAVPVIDDESFHDALFAAFGCLRQETTAAGARDSEEKPEEGVAFGDSERTVLEALAAAPATAEQLTRLSYAGTLPIAAASIPTALANLQRKGAIQRWRDGSYGMAR